MIRTRFAPSPNGSLHMGHAFAAIVAHDRAKADGGEFLLRIEDIDGPRSRPELAQEFRDDLAWLGLSWREVLPQSARLDTYVHAAGRLKQAGLLYPCQCSRAQIAVAARRHGPDGPVYPGTCKERVIDPANAAWRLDMELARRMAGPLEWTDERAGAQQAKPEIFGDVLLLRKDLPASYHLAVTLDDAADGVTHVTRGVDLFAATHLHRLLQALLGLPVPVWHHHPVLIGKDGRKLAKRRGSPSLADGRKADHDGAALARRLRDHDFPSGISLGESVGTES